MDGIFNGGDIAQLLLGVLLVALGYSAVSQNAWFFKLIGFIFALGGVDIALRTINVVTPVQRLLVANVVFISLAVLVFKTKSRPTQMIGAVLVFVGVLSLIVVVPGALQVEFNGTVTQALNEGWDSVTKIFGNAETGLDKVNK